jgi:hypothetical protein
VRLLSLLLATIPAICSPGILSDSDQAYISARTALNRSQFFVYQDIDSPWNHGFPSGLFGSSVTASNKLHTDPGCVYERSEVPALLSMSECSSPGTFLNR